MPTSVAQRSIQGPQVLRTWFPSAHAVSLGSGDSRRRTTVVGAPRLGAEFRLPLEVLTAQDLGASKTAWLDGWRDPKKTFAPSADRPAIELERRARWELYSAEPYAGK